MAWPRRALLLTLGVGVALVSLTFPTSAPATVAEQRQRLPPPAECSDPVQGVWRAHAYRPDKRRWFLNTMELRWSKDRNKLLSSYENHHWSGGPDDSEPGPCQPGGHRRKASSTGEGSLKGNELEVKGTKLGGEETLCGNIKFDRSLGILTGVLDRERNEFRSDMTSRFGTHPIIWRRIRCIDEPKVEVKPPPPPPVEPPPPPPRPSKRTGCGCQLVGRR